MTIKCDGYIKTIKKVGRHLILMNPLFDSVSQNVI